MKELVTRSLTGLVFVILILGSIVLSPYAFFAVGAVFTALGLNEFLKLFYPNHHFREYRTYYFSGLAIYFITGLVGIQLMDVRMMIYVMILFYVMILLELYRGDSSWKRIGIYFGGFFFVALTFGLMNALYFAGNQSGDQFFPGVLLGMFLLIWTNDVFAYLVGSQIGKHRLFERHSPKKSWEGSIGGFVFALIAAWILSGYFHQLNLNQWLTMAVIAVIFGTYGDLAESMLKRNAGVKDSGTLLPGHGGVLDRFDAALFATPFIYLYTSLFVI
jgi:phosphatidate cytidylyltransferase